MTIAEIAQDILRKNDQQHRPLLIAIEGFGGSGKSTVAQQLAKELGSAYVIGMDDFIIKAKVSE